MRIIYRYIDIYVPAINDGNEATVAEGAGLSGDSQAAKGGSTEIKVSAGFRAARTLVGDDDGDGSPGTDAPVQTPNLVTSSASFTAFEENRIHRTNPRMERLHIHQGTVPTRSPYISAQFH